MSKLKRSLHGQKQVGRAWNENLVAGWRKIGFERSASDEYVFHKVHTIFFYYDDDGVFAGPNEHEINESIKSLQALNHTLEINGDIHDYLGINFERKKDNTIKLS